MGFQLPSKAQVGYLDPEIAGEGQKVILSDGEQLNWSPPPPKPVTPDWSGIKSIQKYFNRTGYQVYPAWLYHKDTDESRLVKNADEAAELGVCYREATIEEKGRYGRNAVWDWQDTSPWRPLPNATKAAFDPRHPGQGKLYVPAAPNPTIAQNELLRELVPLVTAAVVQAVKGGGTVAAPASVDAAQWDEFVKFQAWQKSQQAVSELAKPDGDGVNALRPNGFMERGGLEAMAMALGIKADGRWSIERLRAEVEKAEKAAASPPQAA